jgi:hypothetical protein
MYYNTQNCSMHYLLKLQTRLRRLVSSAALRRQLLESNNSLKILIGLV